MRIKSLLIAGGAFASLAGCGSEPRTEEYFSVHLDEAVKVVAQCRSGEMRGDECGAADTALSHARGARDKSHFGDPSTLPSFGSGY